MTTVCGRAKIGGYKPVRVASGEPGKDACVWEEELDVEGDETCDAVERNEELGKDGRHLYDGGPKYGEDYVKDVHDVSALSDV